MYRITDKQQIANAQKIFKDALIANSTAQYICNVGHQGDVNRNLAVYWSESLRFWVAFQEIENRYWNVFGTDKPKYNGYHLGITCEMNFPYSGINRRIAGAFAADNSGSIYVLHNGRIGGGRKGIGQSLFLENYKGEWITLDDETKVVRIGKYGMLHFHRMLQILFMKLIA